MRLKADMGAYDFAAQYQQDPAPRGGGLIKLSWLQDYVGPYQKSANDVIVQSWDTAMSDAAQSDYSVCTTWAIRKTGSLYHYLLLDVDRKQLGFPALQRKIKFLAEQYNPHYILIENKSSGISLIQDLKQGSNLPVKPITPTHDKYTRMYIATPALENGRVFVPNLAPWLDDFKTELSRFPRGKYDDQVDSLSQFLNWADHTYAKKLDVPMCGIA
jgi:predicted phage terminase large subunit-like protein